MATDRVLVALLLVFDTYSLHYGVRVRRIRIALKSSRSSILGGQRRSPYLRTTVTWLKAKPCILMRLGGKGRPGPEGVMKKQKGLRMGGRSSSCRWEAVRPCERNNRKTVTASRTGNSRATPKEAFSLRRLLYVGVTHHSESLSMRGLRFILRISSLANTANRFDSSLRGRAWWVPIEPRRADEAFSTWNHTRDGAASRQPSSRVSRHVKWWRRARQAAAQQQGSRAQKPTRAPGNSRRARPNVGWRPRGQAAAS